MRSLKMQSMTPKSVLNPYRPLAGLRVFLLAALLVSWGVVSAETNLDDLASEGIEKIKQETAAKEAAEAEKRKQAEEAKRKAEKEAADKAAAAKAEAKKEKEHKAAAKAAAEKKEQAEAERKAASSAKAEPDTTGKPAKTKPSAASGSYTINGDGTVTDTKMGLMWKQCSEGRSGAECSVGTAAAYKWGDAMSKFGSSVSFAGYSDWRIPSLDELSTLIYCSNGKPWEEARAGGCRDNSRYPVIDQQSFPNTELAGYWSSTPGGRVAFGAWDGAWVFADSESNLLVRLVRSVR